MGIPSERRYLEIKASVGGRNSTSPFDVYEELMVKNVDIREGRVRNTIYMGRCECTQGGGGSLPLLAERIELGQKETKSEMMGKLIEIEDGRLESAVETEGYKVEYG